MPDLAEVLPATWVPDLLGWPADGRDHLLDWAAASFDGLGPLNDRAVAAGDGILAMTAYAQRARRRRRCPRAASRPASCAPPSGARSSRSRCPMLIIDYLAPSLDTTISAIGNAVWLFATHPDQWQLLRDEPQRVKAAFNEALRLESPISCFTRVARVDTDVGGVELPAGSRVLVSFASANRDERRWDDPERFDITRESAGHLAFGHGEHACVGMGLARLEGAAVLTALVERVATIELDGHPAASSTTSSAPFAPAHHHPDRHLSRPPPVGLHLWPMAAPTFAVPPASATTAPTTTRAAAGDQALGALLAGAGLVHAAMAPAHLAASTADGVGFLVAGTVQLVVAVLVVARPSRGTSVIAAGVSAIALGAWVVSRTAGLPYGAHEGVAESIAFVDGATVALEALALLGAVIRFVRPSGRRPADGDGFVDPTGPILLRGLAVGALALAIAAIASPSARNHGLRGRRGRRRRPRPRRRGEAADDLGFSALANGQMGSHEHPDGPAAEPIDPRGGGPSPGSSR